MSDFDAIIPGLLEEIEVEGGFRYTYILECDGLYKIGHTKDVDMRIRKLQTGNHRKISMICFWYTIASVAIEKELHKRFSSKRVSGEWFRLSNEDVVQCQTWSDRNHVPINV